MQQYYRVLRSSGFLSKTSITRNFLSQSQIIVETNHVTISDEWSNAKPLKSIPRPTKFQLLKGFLPGGRFYEKSLVEVNAQLRREYGDIFILPGVFGKRDLVFTFNPADYQKVFRTEGVHPVRRGLDIVDYHRKIHRPELFKHAAGLVAEQGERWAHFRTTVNPVMMNPKTMKLYAPKMNKLVDKFMQRVRSIRDPQTQEMPADFEEEINHWAFDSVCLVVLDTEMGMIDNSPANPQAKIVIDGMREFFELLYHLDMKPSLWKYIATPKFKKVINTLDIITDLAIDYIDQAIERLNQEVKQQISKPEEEKSVLERLININRSVAVVMAMDTLLAGIDTTSSAFTSCLLCLATNLDKQEKLRDEIRNVLPSKDTAITNEKIKNMPYLRACIKEAFRMYPVATTNFRATGQDIVLSGYRIPKGMDVVMPGQLIMQDAKYFGKPDQFIPERWLRTEENRQTGDCPLHSNVPFIFLPFGFGPRICIGKRIVDLELEISLSKFIRNFNIRFDYSTEKIFKTHFLNIPGKPLKFKFIDVYK